MILAVVIQVRLHLLGKQSSILQILEHLEKAPDLVARGILGLGLGLGLILLDFGDRDGILIVDLFLFVLLRILIHFGVCMALYIHVLDAIIIAEVKIVNLIQIASTWLCASLPSNFS